MSQITVLLPHGRRQTVKVTPNTTILEIIEQVCEKQGLAAEENDLKHHRTILDTTSTVRFAALPQNAQLELVEAKQRRVESPVTLCFQLESGERLHGEFHPTMSLWDAVQRAAPALVEAMSNPVVIYMRREIIGKEALEKTSLRSIGLTGGRAAVRLVDRSLEALRVQANVTAPLRKPAITELGNSDIQGPKQETMEPSELSGSREAGPKVANLPILVQDTRVDATGESLALPTEDTMELGRSTPDVTCPPPARTEVKVHVTSEDALTLTRTEVNDSYSHEDNNVGGKRVRTKSPETSREDAIEKVILLGERDAVAYNLDTAPPAVVEDLPDDFYELTLADVRSLAAASRRALKELEEAPMLTSAQRQLDQDGLILQKLSQHKACVARVRFPDRTVLQGCFKPIETVGAVVDFVRSYLQDPNLKFYLYTTPPKQILREDTRLVEAECVPSVVLYLGQSSTDANRPQTFLKEEVLNKFSSLAAATHAAKQLRESDRSNPLEPTERMEDLAVPSTSKVTNPDSREYSPSKMTETSTNRASSSGVQTKTSTSSHVPKWFKFGK